MPCPYPGTKSRNPYLNENLPTLELIKKDKKALDEGEKTPSQLLKEHSFNLAQSLTELVLNIAGILYYQNL